MFFLCQNQIFFCLIYKVDFCLAIISLRVAKWFATYPVNFISRNKSGINTHDNVQMFGALFPSWFSMKQCSNDCSQILRRKRVKEENRLPHIVKQSQNQFAVVCFASFFCSLLVGSGHCRLFLTRYGQFHVVSCSFQVVSGRFLFVLGCFRSFLARCRSFQVVSGHFRSFRVLVSTKKC